MPKQFVSEIKDRDPVNAVFLVKDKILAMAKNGKPYMNLRLMDKSGDIEAKVWDNTELLDKQFDKDDFVKVRGKASVYMNKMQVVIAEIIKVPEDRCTSSSFSSILRRLTVHSSATQPSSCTTPKGFL